MTPSEHGGHHGGHDHSSSSHSSSDSSSGGSGGSTIDFGSSLSFLDFDFGGGGTSAFTPSVPQWRPSAMPWAVTARQLGFVGRSPLGRCDALAPFGAFVRLLGPYETQSRPAWFHGRVRGAEVVIAPYGVFQPPWTAAIVRIDPPLFLGLLAQRDASPRGWGATSFEPARGAALLEHAPNHGSLQHALATSLARGMSITDSTVVMGLTDGADPSVVTRMLEFGAWVAAGLLQRRQALAPTESERALDATWQSFADDHGLTFDRARRHVHGAIDGQRISLSLGSSTSATFTEVAVGWPNDLGFAAHAAKSPETTSYQVLPQRPLSFGVPTSALPFVLLGDDAAVAGGFLARAPVQAALVALAEGTNEITFHGSGANWITRALSLRSELEWAVETALALARGIVGVAPPATAPYR